MALDFSAGVPAPLGATWNDLGVNFAVHSEVATRIELCLFASDDPLRETARFALRQTGTTFHGFVPRLPVGTLYGLRVHGPWAPEQGARCDPTKLLLDPRAKAVHGDVAWNEHTLGQAPKLSTSDNAAYVPRSVVVDEHFDWEGDRHPNVSWKDTLIYELHVRGFTKLHPDIPTDLRGTYGALAHPAVIEHVVALGVSAVELLPIHAFVDEPFLHARGLTNFWGYNTLCFFAPSPRYARSQDPGASVVEFKQMVKALHRAGIEVLIDVVYNHTCEGGEGGGALSLKGIDNAGYYALGTHGSYVDVTGCGNSVATSKPAAEALVLDSLRTWVRDYHVDGFRFDLATTLGRDARGKFGTETGLWRAILEDPLLAGRKLIAEPWDLGPDGYQVGGFPPPVREWNDKYRDAARRLWNGTTKVLDAVAPRLVGSPDVYASRGPLASINFVTVHDGFTMRDLVSYEDKHNEHNGEGNRDGSNHSESVNYGVEGETDDAEVCAQRDRHVRALLTTLFVSRGVPLLLAGDELGRTQRGNNNAYCQDNEISWVDYDLDARRHDLLAFVRALSALRRRLPHVRRASFEDVGWFDADGRALEASAAVSTFALLLPPSREDLEQEELLLLFNTSQAVAPFSFEGGPFELVFDSSGTLASAPSLVAPARSVTAWLRRAARAS